MLFENLLYFLWLRFKKFFVKWHFIWFVKIYACAGLEKNLEALKTVWNHCLVYRSVIENEFSIWYIWTHNYFQISALVNQKLYDVWFISIASSMKGTLTVFCLHIYVNFGFLDKKFNQINIIVINCCKQKKSWARLGQFAKSFSILKFTFFIPKRMLF